MPNSSKNVRPGWIGKPLTASITGFTVDDTVAGCMVQLRVQMTLSDEFCNYLPAWVTQALHNGDAESLTLQLGERQLGLEFSMAQDPGIIAMRLEATTLSAGMRIFQKQDGWHSRIVIKVPWNERLAAFAGNNLLGAMHMRFFDLESDQQPLFSDETAGKINDAVDDLAAAGVTEISISDGSGKNRTAKVRPRKDIDS